MFLLILNCQIFCKLSKNSKRKNYRINEENVIDFFFEKSKIRSVFENDLFIIPSFAREAVEHALSYNAGLKGAKRPKRLLCIYAGNLAKSNTYLFWQMVKKHLPEQLISSLHFNKGFLLPANGLKLLTANDPGEILSCVNVEEEAVSYAELIRRNML